MQFAPLTCPKVSTGSTGRPHLFRPQTPIHIILPLSREFLNMKHNLSMNVAGSEALPGGLGFLPKEPGQREVARGQSAEVSSSSGSWLAMRRKPNPGLG